MAFKLQEELIFSEKQQIVLHLLESESESDVSEIFYGGAAGGGKSFLGCHWQIARRLQYPETRGLIGRSVLKNLKLTTFKTFQDVWNEYYKDNPDGVTWGFNEKYNVIYFSNGSEILLKDLFAYPSDPDFNSLGSLEISDAFIDELPEIKSKAFEIIQSRIRYKLDIVGAPKTLATGNPSNNWVKTRYIRTKDGSEPILKDYQRVVKATVYDNPDEKFKEVYVKQLSKLNPVDRERLLNGNWDVDDNENPFFYAFNKSKHYIQEKYKINPNFNLDLSFDFNAEPCTVIVGQYIPHNYTYHVIASHYASATNHKSSLHVLCDMIKEVYLPQINIVRIRITGDAAGKHKSADAAANVTKYTQIMKYLGINNKRAVMVESANIEHKASRDLCNDVLRDVPIFFYSGTEELLNDIQVAYADDKGTLNDAKKDDNLGGLHAVDAFRYLIKLWIAFGLRGKKFHKYQDKIKQIKQRARI